MRTLGRSNGVVIIVNVEISKEVVRGERWQGRINAVWMMIRQQMVCVICVHEPQTGRTEAERLAGLSDGQTMLCVASDLNGEQGRARTGGDAEEEWVGGRGHLLPEGEPQNHLQEWTAQDRARPTRGAATAAQEGEGLQSVGGRVCHHTAQTGRL